MNDIQGGISVMAAAFLLIGVVMLFTMPWRRNRKAVENLKPRRISLESSLVRRLGSGAGNAALAAFLWALFYWSVIVEGMGGL